ncbi:MAG: 4-hydroxy-tetrahydrodipicolinate reductase [Thermodesulfobacteriota bacterium]
MIKVSVAGAAGRMGQRIIYCLSRDEGVKIVGAGEAERHPSLGIDAGIIAGAGEIGVPITSDIARSSLDADVIVDFSSPKSTLRNASYALGEGKSMVIGTTGFTEKEDAELKELCRGFPCVLSSNMSIGVNVMIEATRMLARALGDEYDVEIVEAHHRHKVDSPSGTALMIGQAASEGLGRDFHKVARFERHGRIGERKRHEIGIQSLRGGDVVGEHTVMFLGEGERIELAHRALSRDNFAKGAIRAVKWIYGKPPGIYTMKDVLAL